MPAFLIDPEVLARRKDRAQERALKREGLRLASDFGAGKPIDDNDLAMVLGNLVLYAGGLTWLACWAHLLGNSLGGGVLAIGLVPFLAGDILKILLAAALLPTGWKLIRHFGFEKPAQMR